MKFRKKLEKYFQIRLFHTESTTTTKNSNLLRQKLVDVIYKVGEVLEVLHFKKKIVHYNGRDFIFSPAKLASLSADKLLSFRQTDLLVPVYFYPKTFFFFLSLDVKKKTGCGWRHKKRKVFLVRKSFRATVLLGSFNLIFKSFLRRESCSKRSFLSLTSRQVVTFD